VLRRVLAGGVLASVAMLGSRVFRAGMLRSLYPLREDDERFRLLAEKSSDLVCLHEPDGRYLYISPSCRCLLGYEPEDLLGTDPHDLFHPEDLERIRSEAHEKALDGQEAISVTYRIRKESGDYTWFETLSEPILDESGEVIHLQTASRDVSEPRRAEEVLREIVRESSTMSRMVEDLLFLGRTESAAPPFRMEPWRHRSCSQASCIRPRRWPRNTTRPSILRS